LESTILLVCDKVINNKSVSNRTASALVGMCVGHPELVRFGLEGFHKTVDGWFLPDGATSESPGYGMMTLGGIWDSRRRSAATAIRPATAMAKANELIRSTFTTARPTSAYGNVSSAVCRATSTIRPTPIRCAIRVSARTSSS